jgi:hypothetical protein
LHDFIEEIMSYTFDETPNYNKLKFLLTKSLIDQELMPNQDYDWIKLLQENRLQQFSVSAPIMDGQL